MCVVRADMWGVWLWVTVVLRACAAGGAPPEPAALAADAMRLESFYLKLDRLNALGGDGGGGDGGEQEAADEAAAAAAEWRERLVEGLAAQAPALRRDQLERLVSDLREAHAAPAADADADAATPAYADDADDWQEVDDEYPMDDELLEGLAEGEPEGEEWDADDAAPAKRAQQPLPSPPHRNRYTISAAAAAAANKPNVDVLSTAEPPLDDDEWAEETAEERRTAALQHWLLAQSEARCAVPRPRVLTVQSVHPHPGKLYLPQCVVLHRCSADAGCCGLNDLQCAVLRAARVRLPFYVMAVGSSGSTNTEERLTFFNHTICGCMNRTAAEASEATAAEAAVREAAAAAREAAAAAREAAAAAREAAAAAAGSGTDYADENTRRSHLQQLQHLQREAPEYDTDTTQEPAPAPVSRCVCPSEFSVAAGGGGACSCECRSRTRCARLSKGREHFGYDDRRCIKRGECAPPRCEFGSYNLLQGRCPRRRDRDVIYHFPDRLL